MNWSPLSTSKTASRLVRGRREDLGERHLVSRNGDGFMGDGSTLPDTAAGPAQYRSPPPGSRASKARMNCVSNDANLPCRVWRAPRRSSLDASSEPGRDSDMPSPTGRRQIGIARSGRWRVGLRCSRPQHLLAPGPGSSRRLSPGEATSSSITARAIEIAVDQFAAMTERPPETPALRYRHRPPAHRLGVGRRRCVAMAC